jgi:hypothetical protein
MAADPDEVVRAGPAPPDRCRIRRIPLLVMRTLSCLDCAAPVGFPDDPGDATCPTCGTALYVTAGGGTIDTGGDPGPARPTRQPRGSAEQAPSRCKSGVYISVQGRTNVEQGVVGACDLRGSGDPCGRPTPLQLAPSRKG